MLPVLRSVPRGDFYHISILFFNEQHVCFQTWSRLFGNWVLNKDYQINLRIFWGIFNLSSASPMSWPLCTTKRACVVLWRLQKPNCVLETSRSIVLDNLFWMIVAQILWCISRWNGPVIGNVQPERNIAQLLRFQWSTNDWKRPRHDSGFVRSNVSTVQQGYHQGPQPCYSLRFLRALSSSSNVNWPVLKGRSSCRIFPPCFKQAFRFPLNAMQVIGFVLPRND